MVEAACSKDALCSGGAAWILAAMSWNPMPSIMRDWIRYKKGYKATGGLQTHFPMTL
jgi:hypothetical protein